MEDTKEGDSIKKGSGSRKGHETRPGPANEPHALPFPIPWPMEHKKDRSSIKKGKVRSPRKNVDNRMGDMEMEAETLRWMESAPWSIRKGQAQHKQKPAPHKG